MISRKNFHNVFFFLLCKYDFDFVIPLFPFDDFVANRVEITKFYTLMNLEQKFREINFQNA